MSNKLPGLAAKSKEVENPYYLGPDECRIELVDTPFVSISNFGFDSVDRISGRDVEGVTPGAAEAKIGPALGKQNTSEQFSSGTKHLSSIARAGPKVS